MIVVYPYRKSDSEELIYSIKSVKKHLSDAEIHIIGDDPGFTDEQVTLHTPDSRDWQWYSPYHNVIRKVLAACDIADEFILMNDDFFIMEPLEAIPAVNMGKLLDHINYRRYDSYTKAMRNTRNLLLERRLGEVDYESHTPMLINSEKMRAAILSILPQLASSKSILIRSYYGNMYPHDSEQINDVKNPSNPEGMVFISTNEMTFSGELGQYIKEKLS